MIDDLIRRAARLARRAGPRRAGRQSPARSGLYHSATERRRLDRAEEVRARAILAERAFDLAVDLSPGDESRPLLLMTGATYLAGFNPDRFGFVDFGVSTRSRDKVNRLEKLPHAASIAMLVEAVCVRSITVDEVFAALRPYL